MYVGDNGAGVGVRALSQFSVAQTAREDEYAVMNFMRENPIVYSAIRYLASNAQNVPAEMRSRDSGRLIPESRWVRDLVAYPNRYQSFSDLLSDIVVHYSVFGEAFVVFVERGGIISEIYAPPPHQIFFVANRDEEVVGYVWERKNGTRVPFALNDVAAIFAPNVKDDIVEYSMPPLLPVRRVVRTDNYATKLLESFFEHGTINSGIITYNFPIDEDTVRELQERWIRLFSGELNWFAPLVVDSGGQWREIGLQIKDLEALRSIDSRNASAIASVLGVPLSLITGRPETTQSTYSNKAQDREIFYADTLLPMLNRIAAAFNRVLWARNIDARLHFNFHAAPGMAAVLGRRVEMAHSAFSLGAMTFGEYREALGLPSRGEDFDESRLFPLNSVIVNKDGEMLLGPENYSASGRSEPVTQTRDGGDVLRRAYGSYSQVDYAKLLWYVASRYELDVFAACEGPMSWEKREVMRIIDDYYPDDGDDDAEKSRKRAALFAALERLMLVSSATQWGSGLESALGSVAAGSVAIFNARFGTDVNRDAYLKSGDWKTYLATFSAPLAATAHEQLKELVQTAIGDGYTRAEIAASLETLFRQWVSGDVVSADDRYFATHGLPQFRRANIARTEVVRVVNAAQNYVSARAGAVGKEWIAIHDNRTRYTHRIGRTWGEPYIVAMNEPFIVGGAALMYPGDPSGPPEEVVNCRCVAVPVFEV